MISARGAEPVKIGLLLPLTGVQYEFGRLIRNGYLMAAAEINAAGGIRRGPLQGRTVEFLLQDTRSDPEGAAAAAQELITGDKVPLMTGGYGSSDVYAAAQTANRNQVPYLIQTAAADMLTESGWKWVFRLNPPTSRYAGALHDFLLQVVKPRTLAILYEDTLFGTRRSQAMQEWCRRENIEVTNFSRYEPGQNDFKPFLREMKAKDPDVVYLISADPAARRLMRQAREIGLAPELFAGGAADFTLPEFIHGAGGAAENLVSATPWAPDAKYPGAQEFYEGYTGEYGRPPDYRAAEGYAAAYVLRDVLERTASLSGPDLRRAFLETDLMTAFGRINFVNIDKMTNQNTLPTLLVQIQNGEPVTVWPREYAASPYVLAATPGP